MAALVIETPAAGLPVTLAECKKFLREEDDDSVNDALITTLLEAATESAESFTGRSFCRKGYRQSLDSFPYYTDSVQSQQAMPPSYYSAPRYGTSMWNYSQMIKLFRPPLVSVERISYLSVSDQQWHDLVPIPGLWYPGKAYALAATVMDRNNNVQKCTTAGTSGSEPPTWNATVSGTTADANTLVWTNQGPPVGVDLSSPFGRFITDPDSEPARIFPGPPGQLWPPVMYVPNAVQIHFTAGYSADGSAVPSRIKTAIMQTVLHWYENREPIQPGQWQELPEHCKMLLWSCRVMDMAPTRG